MAISYEYDLKVIKLNDLFIVAKDGSLMFQVNSNKISWKINQNNTMEFCITRLVNNSPQLLFPIDTTYQQPHECYTFTKQ